MADTSYSYDYYYCCDCPVTNPNYCCMEALRLTLQKLQDLGINIQITANGTENAVPSSGAVSTEVTNSLVIFDSTIIPLCGIEDVRFVEKDPDIVAQIISVLEETKKNIPKKCNNTCGEELRQKIESGGNIRKITSTTHENLINDSSKPIIATGLSIVLLAEGTTGITKYNFHLVDLCQISVLQYILRP